MLIDAKLLKERTADMVTQLQAQVTMWRFESHCWVEQPDGRRRCSWCGMEHFGNIVLDSNGGPHFDLCMKNPVIELLVGNGRI